MQGGTLLSDASASSSLVDGRRRRLTPRTRGVLRLRHGDESEALAADEVVVAPFDAPLLALQDEVVLVDLAPVLERVVSLAFALGKAQWHLPEGPRLDVSDADKAGGIAGSVGHHPVVAGRASGNAVPLELHVDARGGAFPALSDQAQKHLLIGRKLGVGEWSHVVGRTLLNAMIVATRLPERGDCSVVDDHDRGLLVYAPNDAVNIA